MRDLILGAIGALFTAAMAYKLAALWLREDVDRLLWLVLTGAVVCLAIFLPDQFISALLFLAKHLPFVNNNPIGTP